MPVCNFGIVCSAARIYKIPTIPPDFGTGERWLGAITALENSYPDGNRSRVRGESHP